MENILKFAVQKSGRLQSDSLALLKECGLKASISGNVLKAKVENYPVELLYLRDDDIPGYVSNGVVDAGIVGENVVLEKESKVDVVEKLGFAKCRLSIAVPKSSDIRSIKDLDNKKIATSYPKILDNFLKENNINSTLHEISGSVELAPSIGLSDGICDLVSSGTTLFQNGLKEIQEVLSSEAVLISNRSLSKEKLSILEQLLFRIRSVNQASSNKYIVLNVPNESLDAVVDLLPGMRSPSVTALKQEGWSSVHSLVKENDFWEVIEKLREVGAEGILVLPVEKMIL
ncbi:UNVERIFIED_CONTAM: hypothetical protein GTU68_020695 [Idotea baltica]|nr:hypothetical protein [Idotea baltica]